MTSKDACGCGPKGPEVQDPYQASFEAVWHDPTSYDPSVHAPPYMPGVAKLAHEAKVATRKVASHLADSKVANEMTGADPLFALLAVLRAASFIHQTHHWQTKGGHYYADHLLFDRLYTESQPFIDQVAERMVGLSQDSESVCPVKQSQLVAKVVQLLDGGSSSPDMLVKVSLKTESTLLQVVDAVYQKMEAAGTLTNGTDNLLQGVADLHETFTYLLQQRAAQPIYSYGR